MKVKRLLFVFMLLVISLIASGQNFNQRFRFEKLGVLFYNIKSHGDTLVVIGSVNLEFEPYYPAKLTVSKFDSSGSHYYNQYFVLDSAKAYYPFSSRTHGNKTLVTDSAGYYNSGGQWGFIGMLDSNYTVQWQKDYEPNNGNYFYYFVGGELDANGHIIAVAANAVSEDVTTHLTKFDSLGNLVWEREYKFDELNKYKPWSMLLQNDTTYLLGLEIYPKDGGTLASVRNAIIKTDSSGNVLHFWEDTTGIGGRGVQKMMSMDDGGVLFVGKRYFKDTIIGIPNSALHNMSQSYICRLDSNFNKVWERDVGLYAGSPSLTDVSLYDFIQLADGDYVGVGYSGGIPTVIDDILYYKRNGLVVKFTADGEIIWERYHNYFPDIHVLQ
ncbi:MAG TPA: hypothetical protein ENK85_08515 [Saprospiraceae bacterium]|nr:hypothetical protein [Saprospiraceae bacterium]